MYVEEIKKNVIMRILWRESKEKKRIMITFVEKGPSRGLLLKNSDNVYIFYFFPSFIIFYLTFKKISISNLFPFELIFELSFFNMLDLSNYNEFDLKMAFVSMMIAVFIYWIL